MFSGSPHHTGLANRHVPEQRDKQFDAIWAAAILCNPTLGQDLPGSW